LISLEAAGEAVLVGLVDAIEDVLEEAVSWASCPWPCNG